MDSESCDSESIRIVVYMERSPKPIHAGSWARRASMYYSSISNSSAKRSSGISSWSESEPS